MASRTGLAILAEGLDAARRRETPEDRAERQRDQDPTWSCRLRADDPAYPATRRGFCAHLRRWLPSYTLLRAWALAHGHGSPSSWPMRWRLALLDRLEKGALPELYQPGIDAERPGMDDWLAACPRQRRRVA